MKKLLIILLLPLFASAQIRNVVAEYNLYSPPKYSKLDPSKNSTYITLSNGNLSGTDNSGATQSSMTLSVSGKTVGGSGIVHCEFTFSVYSPNVKFGVSTISTSLDAQPQNNDINSWSFKPDGFFVTNATLNQINTSISAGKTVGMDLNLASGVLSFSVEGIPTTTATAATLSAGTYYVSVGFYQFASSVTVNFGDKPFISNPGNNPGWL